MSNQPIVAQKSTAGVVSRFMETAWKLIEEAAECIGGQKELAEALGVSPQAVAKWKKSRIPAERVLDIERVTSISKSRLRPDLYPAESAA